MLQNETPAFYSAAVVKKEHPKICIQTETMPDSSTSLDKSQTVDPAQPSLFPHKWGIFHRKKQTTFYYSAVSSATMDGSRHHTDGLLQRPLAFIHTEEMGWINAADGHMDTTVDTDIIYYKLNAAFIEESHLDAASELC